jgi:methionyl-tRNA formyltransferase
VNLVFLGSGAFGIPTLARLARAHTLRAVISQPDRPAGRGGKLSPTPVADWAGSNAPNVPILKPEKINTPEVVAEIRAFDADAFVVIAFGQKLGRALLDDIFAINLHASLLPRWRGAAPINAAVLAGDSETGNSVISLADRMDAGLIYARSRRPITPELTAGELHDLLAADGPALVERVLSDFARGTLQPATQDESLVTLAPKLSRTDARVDFAESAEECRRRIHGLTPWPGITVALGQTPLKLLRVQVAPEIRDPESQIQDLPPGALIDPTLGHVACGHGTLLRLLEVQPAGRKRMDWPEYVRGHRVRRGDRLILAGAGGATA